MLKPTETSKTRGRALKRRKTSDTADEEDFVHDDIDEAEELDESMFTLSYRSEASAVLLCSCFLTNYFQSCR